MKNALSHLKKDPIMRLLVEKHDAPKLRTQRELFEDIVNTIIGQQLSGKAADTISGRFWKLVGKSRSPKKIVGISNEKLRGAGISYAKIKYIKGVCQSILDKELILEEIPGLSDEEVRERLTQLKGIGNWTAEMLLMFSLQRPDVFSLGDLGLRKAVSRLYKVDINDLKAIEEISKRWSPHRTIAAVYLWKSLDES